MVESTAKPTWGKVGRGPQVNCLTKTNQPPPPLFVGKWLLYKVGYFFRGGGRLLVNHSDGGGRFLNLHVFTDITEDQIYTEKHCRNAPMRDEFSDH